MPISPNQFNLDKHTAPYVAAFDAAIETAKPIVKNGETVIEVSISDEYRSYMSQSVKDAIAAAYIKAGWRKATVVHRAVQPQMGYYVLTLTFPD